MEDPNKSLKNWIRKYEMTNDMKYVLIICTSTLQELPLEKEGMGLRKFGKKVLLFWYHHTYSKKPTSVHQRKQTKKWLQSFRTKQTPGHGKNHIQ